MAQNLNGFLWPCVRACTFSVSAHVCVSRVHVFFPWLKPLSLSAGPQIASLIWHVSHSQFPPLMHDSCALCSTGGCGEESTTTACLCDTSNTLSLFTLLQLFLIADESHCICLYSVVMFSLFYNSFKLTGSLNFQVTF